MNIRNRIAVTSGLAAIAACGALLVHSARFDFTCDDAFITLRYAENFARTGSPVYNVGEHVEGYTNFLWMALVAAGVKLGASAVASVRVLGAASGVALVLGTLALARRVEPARPAFHAAVLACVALSAPIAAWTLSGLETPLFTALVAFGIAAAADVVLSGATARSGALAGAVLALATMTRPEGALFLAFSLLVVGFVRTRARLGLAPVVAMLVAYVAIVAPFVTFRWVYYGYPLPNTFYLKASGDPAALRAQGLAYLELAGSELGFGFVGLTALALAVPSRVSGSLDETLRRRALLLVARFSIVAFVPYVLSVGGDFLDLYRFFVPLLPLAFVAIENLVARIEEAAPGSPRIVVFVRVAMLALLGLYGVHHQRLGARARLEAEPARAARAIEPLGWTRTYALRWAAMGRWLAAHSSRGDSLAVGAAGAMPYYSHLPNLDTFGLCDAFVAHHGDIVGSRPGHQRFAPDFYIASRRPTFLLVGSDFTSDSPLPTLPAWRDPRWESRGYRFVEARVDAETYGAPRTFYHYILVDQSRLDALRGTPDARVP